MIKSKQFIQILAGTFAGLIFGIISLLGLQLARAYVSTQMVAQPSTYKTFSFFATSTANTAWLATTTTATSTNIAAYADANGQIDTGAFNIAGAKSVTLYFSRGDTVGTGNSGNTLFRIQTTRDGVNWDFYNTLVQNLATSTTPTMLPSITITAATSTVVAAMNQQTLSYMAIRCIAVKTTDGEAYCAASATW